MDCLKIELMSSEESDGEEDKLIVRPPSWREIPVILSWRSADTNKFIELLDGPIHKNKSAQSKRQMKKEYLVFCLNTAIQGYTVVGFLCRDFCMDLCIHNYSTQFCLFALSIPTSCSFFKVLLIAFLFINNN